MGYFLKPFSLAIIINFIYLPAGMYLPRLIEGKVAKKVDSLDHLLIALYFACIGLIIGVIMLYAGKLIRYIVNPMHKNKLNS